MKFVAVTWLILLAMNTFTPSKRYVKKAEKSIEKGNLKSAKIYFHQALDKKPDDRKANLELGLMMSELQDNYTGALPFLEKAYQLPAKDSSYDLLYALAKCYHHNEEYEKALSYYKRLDGVVDLEREEDFEKEILKCRKDCEYANAHRYYPIPENIYLVNAGKNINTDMPEYVPVLTPKNQLIFTSKRKDTRWEELSYLDGKYYESIYMADISPGGFKNIRRYALPESKIKSFFRNNHQAVVSLSQDGKKLFTFKDAKIYEIDLAESNVALEGGVQEEKSKPERMLQEKGFDYYQSSAFLTRDGKTLYFSSEAEGGLGGTDIYKCSRNLNGEWSSPQNLGEPINTSFDEDAPFVSHDGTTFYFASKGHEGYGNYDIYKSYFFDGKWTQPENLGKPYNSPGHDIFLIHDSIESFGYFASGRNGGFGDMDIYKIIYLDKMKKDCPGAESPLLTLVKSDRDTADLRNRIEVTIPSNFKILEYAWKVDNKPVSNASGIFENDYGKPGTYRIDSKIVAYCDTCLQPFIGCNSIFNTIVGPPVETITVTAPAFNLSDYKGVLTSEQAAALGFDASHLLFDFNSSKLRQDAVTILDHNIAVLKEHRELKLQINGYSDSRGTEDHNKQLSALRAKTVKDYLLKNGVAKNQVRSAIGKGAEKLINDCGKGVDCDDAAHQQNRRVEFTVTINE